MTTTVPHGTDGRAGTVRAQDAFRAGAPVTAAVTRVQRQRAPRTAGSSTSRTAALRRPCAVQRQADGDLRAGARPVHRAALSTTAPHRRRQARAATAGTPDRPGTGSRRLRCPGQPRPARAGPSGGPPGLGRRQPVRYDNTMSTAWRTAAGPSAEKLLNRPAYDHARSSPTTTRRPRTRSATLLHVGHRPRDGWLRCTCRRRSWSALLRWEGSTAQIEIS